MFVEQMKKVLDNDYNTSVTENGAVGYATQGSKLVDINFATASLRHKTYKEIVDMFANAYYENPLLAIKWLFYLGDIREGLGERRSFRVIMQHLAEEHSDIAMSVVELIPEYNRWDSLIGLMDCNNSVVANKVLEIIKKQLNDDNDNMKSNKPISLLTKWLPSINTSSAEAVSKAKIIAHYLGYSEKQYRKTLSALRKYLNVVECKMSAKEWSEINYSTVPSNANVKYSKAFMRNDEERRKAYLESLAKGEAKINAGVLFPHDVVHKYVRGHGRYVNSYDEALEQMWKSLKDMGDIHNTIVVADGSGSMMCTVDNASSVTALEVANALAIYCGERCNGEFKDKYITFSRKPQLVDFTNANSLCEKLGIALRHSEIADTNIEAVFDLILKTAVNNNMAQDEIPKNILIISDMEFNSCACANGYNKLNATLFDNIANKYAQHGYKLPKLIFWNVNSRTNTIPVKENDLGIALVSGFSVNVLNMVMSNKLNPYDILVDVLNSKRYEAVEQAVQLAQLCSSSR